MDLNWLSIAEAHKGLKEKKFSAVDLLNACTAQIEKTKDLNSFITLVEKEATLRAKEVDAKIARGEEISILEGIPCGIKDLINTRGIKTTCASKMLENFVPPYDATVVSLLKKAGCVILGKTNLDEFACGASTEHSYFGPVKNPWDKKMVAGGSSGGSAAAVASGEVMYALGTDTGGSIRQPASLCGCVGLKVTYGRVSRFGITAMASSWDTVGPLARTVEDIAIILNAIAGPDSRDATTPKIPVTDYTKNLKKGVKGLKIGVPEEYFAEGISEDVRKVVLAAIAEYEKLGAEIVKISLPMTKYGIAVYYITMPTELSANLARFDGVRFGHKTDSEFKDLNEYYMLSRGEGFGTEIKRRIMIGTFASSAGYADAYYKQAQKVRTLIIKDFADAFKKCDVICAPVSPSPAFKIGEKMKDPLSMYMGDLLTIPASAAGIPGISIPCGFSSTGLPVGLQILGPQWSESLILQVAAVYEQSAKWHEKRPNV